VFLHPSQVPQFSAQVVAVVAVTPGNREALVETAAEALAVTTLLKELQELQTQAVDVVAAVQKRQVPQMAVLVLSFFVILVRNAVQAEQLLQQVVTQSTPSHHLAHTPHNFLTTEKSNGKNHFEHELSQRNHWLPWHSSLSGSVPISRSNAKRSERATE
jgi:hypothetical protein